MWDVPYLPPSQITPELVASLTRVCSEVRRVVPSQMPCGVQVLAGGGKEALAICKSAEFQFIRVESFVFSHVADEGWMDACAPQLLRYRRLIGADDVLILADIKKKHSAHSVTSDVSVAEMANAADFFLADGVILTGSATGQAASIKELKEVKQESTLPVLVGSGITLENVNEYFVADGFIVGSFFKTDGRWSNELDVNRIKEFVERVKSSRLT